MKGVGNPQHFLAGGQGALPQDSNGRPWNGDYVFSSGDLVEDLTHNFFLETGEDLVVFEEAPEGVPPRDLPPQPAVFAPDYAPEQIAEIAAKRQTAGLPKEPTGLVADLQAKTKRSTKKATSRSKPRSG